MTTCTASSRFPRIAKTVVVAATLLFLGVEVADANSSMNMPSMQPAPTGNKFAFGEPGKRDKVDRTVKIVMTDGSFEPSSLEVKVGDTVRFVVTNKGEADHEFTLGDAETQAAHRKEMIEMAEKGGEMHAGDDPNAISVKAGKTGTLIWKFTHAGSLEFDCNVPGHYEAGMTGVISVVAKPGGHAALTA